MAEKGLYEAFNRRMDAFYQKVALNKPRTLHELNESLKLWIRDYYHKNVHSALDGLTPAVAFSSDKRRLKFVEAYTVNSLYLVK